MDRIYRLFRPNTAENVNPLLIDDESFIPVLVNRRDAYGPTLRGYSEYTTMKILCVSLNTQSKIFCGNRNQTAIGRHKCKYPDFLDALRPKIEGCDIFVFSTQEDDEISELHKSVKDEMKLIEFKLVADSELLGYGTTSMKTVRSRGLRMAVFIKNNLFPRGSSSYTHVCTGGGWIKGMIGKWAQNKGGICVLLTIANTTLLFCNFHLPFDSKTLRNVTIFEGNQEYYNKNITDNINVQTQCLNDALSEFITGREIDSMIIMGDLNYRLTTYEYDRRGRPHSVSSKITDLLIDGEYNEVYTKYDELKKEIEDGNINRKFNGTITNKLSEGVDDRGITFPPTCKMYNNKPGAIEINFPRQRYRSENVTEGNRCTNYYDDDCYKMGDDRWRIPSFCDRILYTNLSGRDDFICTEYNSLSSKEINTIDHNLVYGSYEITF